MTDLEKAFSYIYFLCYIIPAVLVVTGLPLALKIIEPNGTYGFRTSKTLADPQVWYSVNMLGGVAFVVAGLKSFIGLVAIQKYWTATPYLKFFVGFALPLLLTLGVVWGTFQVIKQ